MQKEKVIFTLNCQAELDSGSHQRNRKSTTLVRFRLGGRSTESRAIHWTRACGQRYAWLNHNCHAELDSASHQHYEPKLNEKIQQKYQCGIKGLSPCLLLKSHVVEIPGQARNDTNGQGGLLKATRAYGQRRLSRFHNEFWAIDKRTNYDKRAEARHKLLLTYLPTNLLTSAAFTMAEILLSLTIIGVVAAITLPSRTGNINSNVLQ